MAKKTALSKALDKRTKKSAKKGIKQAAPQSKTYTTAKDKKEKAKPAGYRFKGLSNFKTPTKKEIAADAKKPRSKRKTYFENRKDKSDKKPSNKFEAGGATEILKTVHDGNTPTEVQDAVFAKGGEIKTIRKNADALITRFAGGIKSKKSIESFLKAIYLKLELNFHPDNPFEDYVVDGKEIFTKIQAKRLNKIMDGVFKYADKHNIDVYEIALPIQKEALAKKGIGEPVKHEEGGPILPEDATQSDVMEHGGEANAEPVIEPVVIEVPEEPIIEPEVEIKLKTTQKAIIPNVEAAAYAENLIDFAGTNLEGKKLANGDYVVLSFGYYPIWYYCAKNNSWYGNTDKYNTVTSMHMSNSRPTPNAEMLSLTELMHKMNQGIEQYDMGGSVLVRQLYPMTTDNTTLVHQ